MRDRYVCVVDPGNPRLAKSRLTLRDLAEMPHAASAFGKRPTRADRRLETLGITPRVRVSASGFTTLPFLVGGTDLVALVPQLPARHHAGFARCVAVPTPLPEVPLVEAMYWHHNGTPTPRTAGCGRRCAGSPPRWAAPTGRSARRPPRTSSPDSPG